MNRNTNSSAKPQPSTSNSNKPRKTAKEKRKNQLEQQQAATATNKNNSSPSKEGTSNRKYAGITGDSIIVYAEQTNEEGLTEDVCDRLAEDINYKLRQIIHTSMVKAHLSGRSELCANDIDETFHTLNINKVYGAPLNPEFIPFGDEGLYYLNDTEINLIETSEEDISYLQPGEVTIEKEWWKSEDEDDEEAHELCFKTVCEMLISKDSKEQRTALDFVETDYRIGSIIDWFYNFAYFLLNEHSSCDHLTICAYSLIESLERNPITYTSVSEKQLTVLACLLLQKIFTLNVTSNFLRYTCTTLGLLCRRSELRRSIFAILKENMAKIKNTHSLHLLILISSMGIDAVSEFFIPFIDDYFNSCQENFDVKFELLAIFNVIFKDFFKDDAVYQKYFSTFEEIICLYSLPKQEILNENTEETPTGFDRFILSLIDQKTSVSLSVNLIKTRRKLPIANVATTKMDINSIFECDNVEERRIKFVGSSVSNLNLREKTKKIYKDRKSTFSERKSILLIGRTTLLSSVFKNVQYECKKTECYDHSLRNYNF